MATYKGSDENDPCWECPKNKTGENCYSGCERLQMWIKKHPRKKLTWYKKLLSKIFIFKKE